MLANYNLTEKEIKVLEKIARVSKMDCWFGINEKGQCVDYENGSKVYSTKNLVAQLIDGATEYDLDSLSHDENLTLIYLLGRLV